MSRASRRFGTITLVLAFAAATFVLGPVSSVEAYTLTGCKFSSRNVTYSYGSYGFPSAYITQHNSATSNWATTTDVSSISYSSGGSGSSHYRIWTRNYGNVSWDGRASWSCSGGVIVSNSATIEVNTHHTSGYVANKRRSVIAHEVGHLLGLGHSAGCVLMNGSSPTRYDSCGVYTTRADDRNGVNALY